MNTGSSDNKSFESDMTVVMNVKVHCFVFAAFSAVSVNVGFVFIHV